MAGATHNSISDTAEYWHLLAAAAIEMRPVARANLRYEPKEPQQGASSPKLILRNEPKSGISWLLKKGSQLEKS